MLIRQSELEIPVDDPFRNDALKRKELEPPLTQFVTQALGPFVLALDGSWGSGKTTFLRMWQSKLAEAGHACLYLNAWKTDFAQEPLVAVIGELSSTIEDFAPTGKSGVVLRRHMKKARQIAESIAKRSIPVGIKLATLGILDTKDLTEKIISDFASEIVEDRIKDYEKGKSEIEEFRKSLASLASEVEKLKSGSISAKVVVIIDELDRCRPTYAVQLLERIKHLFDVPGLVFILGIDRSQLNHSIRALYGTDFNAQGYLRRFVDLDYRLPEPKAGDYSSHLFKLFGIEELMSKRQTRNKQELETLKSLLGCFMSAAGMSLREQEQTVARLRIVLQTIPVNHFLFEMTLSILLFFREWNIDIYTALLAGEVSIKDFLTRVEQLPNIKEVSEELDRDLIEAVLLVGLTEFGVTSSHLKEYQQLVNSTSSDPDFSKAQRILNLVAYINNSGAGFKITALRLALTSPFVPYDDEGTS
jgi:hypothetical protein